MVQQDGDVGLRCPLRDLLYGTLIFHSFLVVGTSRLCNSLVNYHLYQMATSDWFPACLKISPRLVVHLNKWKGNCMPTTNTSLTCVTCPTLNPAAVSCGINALIPTTGRNSPQPLCLSWRNDLILLIVLNLMLLWPVLDHTAGHTQIHTRTPLLSNNCRIYVMVLNYLHSSRVHPHEQIQTQELFPPPAPLSFFMNVLIPSRHCYPLFLLSSIFVTAVLLRTAKVVTLDRLLGGENPRNSLYN